LFSIRIQSTFEIVLDPVRVPHGIPDGGGCGGDGGLVKTAVTAFEVVKSSKQEIRRPEHAPSQRENRQPTLAPEASLTRVPGAKLARQVAGQEMPRGVLVTLPPPLTTTAKVLRTGTDDPTAIEAPATATSTIAPTAVTRRLPVTAKP
jgi:hypothetical protein